MLRASVMRIPAFAVAWVLIASTWALATTGCGGDKGRPCASGSGPDCNDPLADGGSDAGRQGVDGGQEEGCRGDQDCGGGFCVGGTCCPSPECGGECCSGDEICFAGACATPGEACRNSRDCGEDRYCEPSLVDPAGDLPEPVGKDCLHELPPEGRCLDLPPVCEDEPGDDPECLPRCEYHPPVGALEAITEWRWGPVATDEPELTDVWATPTVGRLVDSNCDGAVDDLDPPNVVFVSGNALGTCCSCGGYAPSTCLTGVLRVLDGKTGQEVWSLRRASDGSIGFAGLSVALGDIDDDGRIDIAAMTGEGKIVVVDAGGAVLMTSDLPVVDGSTAFGWGGGLAIADMDGDGAPEIAYGSNVFTTAGGALTRLFVGAAGVGGGAGMALSVFANVDADPDAELVAGKAVYDRDGTVVWSRPGLSEGFPAVGDLDGDGAPEVVLVGGGQVWVLEGATGATELGPLTLPGTGAGGPPTIADFDGDDLAEIGVAQANYYSVLNPDYEAVAPTLGILWQAPNHDLSSSVTGSTVFDFEGDGIAEVVYNDECFLWVYDGPTGEIRFATPTTSFTATEASLVADVDGDGHAEILMVSNGADPGPSGWGCDVAPWNAADPSSVRPAWTPPEGGRAYRGITLLGDASSAWVGTRTLWNEHSYHVSNVCDDRDDACDVAANTYGAIPARERANWQVPWLNNFRQNAQDEGIFDAPDATVTLDVGCESPPILTATVRNLGQALLPAGVEVAFWRVGEERDDLLGTATTEAPLFAGQVAELELEAPGTGPADLFVARIVLDPDQPAFRQCREDNDSSGNVSARCVF